MTTILCTVVDALAPRSGNPTRTFTPADSEEHALRKPAHVSSGLGLARLVAFSLGSQLAFHDIHMIQFLDRIFLEKPGKDH